MLFCFLGSRKTVYLRYWVDGITALQYSGCMEALPAVDRNRWPRKRPVYSFTLPQPLVGRLDALAKERGWSRSEALEEVLGTYFSGPSGHV